MANEAIGKVRFVFQPYNSMDNQGLEEQSYLRPQTSNPIPQPSLST